MTGRSQRHLREIQGVDSAGETNDASYQKPVAGAVPTIAGTAQVGVVLTGTNGTFTNPSQSAQTIARQWLANDVVIAGATGATYTPVIGDIGKTIKFRNTATNAFGTAVSTSVATAAVIAA